MKYSFSLRNNEREFDRIVIGQFDALISEIDLYGTYVDRESIPKYLKIENRVFKSVCIDGGRKVIFVNPAVFPKLESDSKIISTSKASFLEFLLCRLKFDNSLRNGFIGLFLGSCGLIIDSSFIIGEYHLIKELSFNEKAFYLILSMILKILGLGFLFFKDFWSEK